MGCYYANSYLVASRIRKESIIRYDSYHPYAVPSRSAEPPDEPDFWEESIPQWVARVSDANGVMFYETPYDDDEDAVFTEAACWITKHQGEFLYAEYLEVLTEQVADRIAIHGNDPYDVPVEY